MYNNEYRIEKLMQISNNEKSFIIDKNLFIERYCDGLNDNEISAFLKWLDDRFLIKRQYASNELKAIGINISNIINYLVDEQLY